MSAWDAGSNFPNCPICETACCILNCSCNLACAVPTGSVPVGLAALSCSPAAILATSSGPRPKKVLPSGVVIPDALPVSGSVNVSNAGSAFGVHVLVAWSQLPPSDSHFI